MPCLKHLRPDLGIFTIATPPSGLTVVTGLDPRSEVLTEWYDDAVESFGRRTFASIQTKLDTALNVVPNDWNGVRERLSSARVLPSEEAAWTQV